MLLADFSAEDMEGIEDIVVVFTDRYFIESTAQHVGQLKSMLRLHLFNMQEISFVCYDDNGDGVSWVQLSNVMVKVTEEFIALIICDGEDNHQGVCPANASVQLLVTIQTVLMDLNSWGVLHLDRQHLPIYLDVPAVEVTCVPLVVPDEAPRQEPHHERCLAHAAAPHHGDLDEARPGGGAVPAGRGALGGAQRDPGHRAQAGGHLLQGARGEAQAATVP